ncbi:SRPBCC family protein [Kribbella sp. NPDC051770]|uniref:SRPBCC family protein n=1 Tax=Kribbella sp. NPDC051770 TaxID=3155413 RepID=UPI00343DB1AC
MSESLTSADGRTVLRMERRLAHPPEKVWRALTEPGELAHWYPALVELDLRLDGKISFTFDGEDGGAGVVRAYEPPRLLEFTWGEEIQRWEVEPTGEGCVLTLTTTYDDRPGSASFTSGWILCLDALNASLGGQTVARDNYKVLHEHYVKVYGLDAGERRPDGSLYFERQLTAPKEEVWPRLAKQLDVDPPEGDELRVNGAELTLRDGNGGARLVLTQTDPAPGDYESWRALIESVAAESATY